MPRPRKKRYQDADRQARWRSAPCGRSAGRPARRWPEEQDRAGDRPAEPLDEQRVGGEGRRPAGRWCASRCRATGRRPRRPRPRPDRRGAGRRSSSTAIAISSRPDRDRHGRALTGPREAVSVRLQRVDDRPARRGPAGGGPPRTRSGPPSAWRVVVAAGHQARPSSLRTPATRSFSRGQEGLELVAGLEGVGPALVGQGLLPLLGAVHLGQQVDVLLASWRRRVRAGRRCRASW